MLPIFLKVFVIHNKRTRLISILNNHQYWIIIFNLFYQHFSFSLFGNLQLFYSGTMIGCSPSVCTIVGSKPVWQLVLVAILCLALSIKDTVEGSIQIDYCRLTYFLNNIGISYDAHNKLRNEQVLLFFIILRNDRFLI